MAMPMRQQEPNKLAVELAATLAFVAREYGATKEIPAETLGECVKLVMRKFGALGIQEIREAYRMAAAGEIKPEQKMWGGIFNAAQLGSVLTTYQNHRKAIAAELIKTAHDRVIAQEAVVRETKWREIANPTFLGMVSKLKGQISHWCEVPPMYWAMAKALKLVEMKPSDVERIMQAAKDAVPAERLRRADPGPINLATILAARGNGTDDTDLAKEIAGKMAFFEIFIAEP